MRVGRAACAAVLVFTVGPVALAANRSEDDPFRLSLYWENDGAYTKVYEPSDKHYTAGIGAALQWQSPNTDDLVGMLPTLDAAFAKTEPLLTYSAGVLYSLRIYTPRDISNPDPIPDDRPYAGWGYLGLIAQRANRGLDTPTFEHWELDGGVMGEESQGEAVQKFVHGIIGSEHPKGWSHQVQDELGVDFRYHRRWRMDLADHSDSTPALQLIPYGEVTVGTIHINGSAGAILRYGWNLPDDFGPNQMSWVGDFTAPHAADAQDFGGYIFLRSAARLVLHDATFGDSFFNDNEVEVDTYPLVAELQIGAAIQLLDHLEVAYSQTFLSQEFEGQGRWDSYASVTVSYTWSW